MTRLAIRLAVLPVTLSAFASLVLVLDWLSGGLPPWVAEGVWPCCVAVAPSVGAVVVIAVAIASHCVTDLLAALWIPVPHAWRIAEAEARGEAPA